MYLYIHLGVVDPEIKYHFYWCPFPFVTKSSAAVLFYIVVIFVIMNQQIGLQWDVKITVKLTLSVYGLPRFFCRNYLKVIITAADALAPCITVVSINLSEACGPKLWAP